MSDKYNKQIHFLVNIAYYAVVIVIIYILYKYVFGLLLPFILAFCIVSIVHPIIRQITSTLKINQKIIAVIIMAVVYGLLGFGIFWIFVQLFVLIKEGLILLPGIYSDKIAPAITAIGNFFTENTSNFPIDLPIDIHLELSDFQGDILSAIQSGILNLSEKGISVITKASNKIPSFFISLVFTIMLSFFISMQYNNVIKFIKNQLRPETDKLLKDIKTIFFDTILKYIKAYFILMIITFIEISIGLVIIGVESPIAIAGGIAVFDALPFFGTGAVMIPWIIFELIQGNLTLAMGLAILYGIVTCIRNIIEPKVVGDQLGLNPIVTLMVIYIGFKLFGVMGMIFMPITAQIIIALHKNGNIKLYK